MSTRTLQRRLNKRTIGIQLVAQTKANHALRDEWNEMLALNATLRSQAPHPSGTDYLDAEDRRLRTLLAALDAPAVEGVPFVCEFYSVGNPDFGQYHGKGDGSPTFTVEAPDLITLVRIQQAYIAIYDLGGGNCPNFQVWRDGVEVARISYNGRVWTPFEYNDPCRKEIDPTTGKERAS